VLRVPLLRMCQAAVFGAPDRLLGEKVVACVKIAPSQSTAEAGDPKLQASVEKSIIGWCFERLSYYKASLGARGDGTASIRLTLLPGDMCTCCINAQNVPLLWTL
jgi:hypothetical protein